MNQQIRVVIFTFFLVGNLGFCKGQTSALLTEEQQFRKEMNEWMQPYRREKAADFEQWIDWVENHINGVWQHPVYKHINSFYRQHQQQYLRLRKADLARYKPAPKLLPEYEQVPNFYVPYDDKSFPLESVLQLAQGIGNFRTLSVADTRFVAEMLYGYALEYLKAEKHLTQLQIVTHRIYGDLFFADALQTNLWQITIINQLYALRFNWNIADNHVSIPEFWVYTGKRQPRGWLNGQFPKSYTATQQSDSSINTFRWSLYDDADREVLDFHNMVSVVPKKLAAYYQAHRKDYIRLRNEELAKYPPPDTAYARTFEYVNTDLKQDLLTVLEKEDSGYKISSLMAPYETEGAYTIHNFRYMLMLNMKNHAEYDLTDWIAGIGTYSEQVAKNIWKIQFFYHKYAVSFRWNVATDEISDLTVKTREAVTVDRPVGDPTETN